MIPARDAEASVGSAVSHVLDQRDAQGRPVRVIVIDDGSVDETGRVAADAGATVLRAEGTGPARARNLGVAAAETDLIVFTDADCSPRPGFVAALTAPFDDPQVAGTKGAYECLQREWVARFVQIEYEERYDRMRGRPTIDFIDTYAAAYRRAVLDEVGGFDERYLRPSTEDQELSFRVAATGAKLLFVPEARVGHLHAATLSSYARKKTKIGFFKVATLRRHPGKAVSDTHTPATLKLQVLLAPLVWLGLLGLPIVAASGLAPQAALPLAGGLLTPLLLFALTALPLWVRVLRRDPPVALAAPGLILIRATALGLGLVLGLLAESSGGILSEPEPIGPPT